MKTMMWTVLVVASSSMAAGAVVKPAPVKPAPTPPAVVKPAPVKPAPTPPAVVKPAPAPAKSTPATTNTPAKSTTLVGSTNVPGVTIYVGNPLIAGQAPTSFQPIAGQKPVNFQPFLATNLPLKTATSDANGRFEVSLPPERYVLTATKTGCTVSPESVTVDLRAGSGTASFTLTCAFSLTGVVQNTSEATLTLVEAFSYGMATKGVSARTDTAGKFLFTGLPAGSYNLAISAPGCKVVNPQWVDVPNTGGIIFSPECPSISGAHITILNPVCNTKDAYFIVRQTYPESYGPAGLTYAGWVIAAPPGSLITEIAPSNRSKEFATEVVFPIAYAVYTIYSPLLKVFEAANYLWNVMDATSRLGTTFAKSQAVTVVQGGWSQPYYRGDAAFEDHIVHVQRQQPSTLPWPTNLVSAEWVVGTPPSKLVPRFPSNCK